MLQALGGRLPHLPAAGFGRGDAGVTLEGAGVRGAAVPLYMWVGVRATCVLEPVGAGGREQEEAARRTAAGNLEGFARSGRVPRTSKSLVPSAQPSAGHPGGARGAMKLTNASLQAGQLSAWGVCVHVGLRKVGLF